MNFKFNTVTNPNGSIANKNSCRRWPSWNRQRNQALKRRVHTLLACTIALLLQLPHNVSLNIKLLVHSTGYFRHFSPFSRKFLVLKFLIFALSPAQSVLTNRCIYLCTGYSTADQTIRILCNELLRISLVFYRWWNRFSSSTRAHSTSFHPVFQHVAAFFQGADTSNVIQCCKVFSDGSRGPRDHTPPPLWLNHNCTNASDFCRSLLVALQTDQLAVILVVQYSVFDYILRDI